ncbi:MAG: sulfatase-like hydrolase/transferase [Gammaproteobacteria bacterium]|nr:MAG: sulfatase-like hydrolase/transferase [Gammaproteobacteria bacterium]
MLYLCMDYLADIHWNSVWSIVFSVSVWLTYAFFYLLPALFITKLVQHLCNHSYIILRCKWCSIVPYCIAVAAVTLSNILVYADSKTFILFGFHINSFVWNLISTPGGIESMGSDESSYVSLAMVILTIVLVNSALMLLLYNLYRRHAHKQNHKPRKVYRYAMALLLTLTLGERIGYVFGDIYASSHVYTTANAFPLYKPTKFRTLANYLDIDNSSTKEIILAEQSSSLHYPLNPIDSRKPKKPLNIIWLVAESLRWDMLDKTIMPATWSFSQKAHRFTRHYSGGNGTRMGMFSMFYGIYGPYWNQFLAEGRRPVLMDLLQQQGYQMEMFTSAKFSYPEFDKTIFKDIPASHLHQNAPGEPEDRDHINISNMISFIKQRDKSRPFMSFMFFESTHARYYYPEGSEIRLPALENVNYVSMSRKTLTKDIDQIKNRYINASHYIDSQIERLIHFLQSTRLLDNTIVIVTGDHGEEFMEKGRWGHNSNFVDEQIRTPFVLWVPGTGSGEHHELTSHLDIIPTLLPLLGVNNPSPDYSLGINVLGTRKRPYAVVSDWNRIAYIGLDYKYTIPYRRGLLTTQHVTDNHDHVVADETVFFHEHQGDLLRIISEMKVFRVNHG